MLRDYSLETFSVICAGTALSRMRMQSTLREAARRILGNSLYDRIRTTMLGRANSPD